MGRIAQVQRNLDNKDQEFKGLDDHTVFMDCQHCGVHRFVGRCVVVLYVLVNNYFLRVTDLGRISCTFHLVLDPLKKADLFDVPLVEATIDMPETLLTRQRR